MYQPTRLANFGQSSVHSQCLLTLVTAMNDEFHRSTLPHTSSDGAQALECGRQTIHSLALNAIATILVRDNEIVAVSSSKSPPTSAPNHRGPRFLVVLQNEPHAKRCHSTNAPTPDDKYVYLAGDPAHQYALVPSGTSHWPSILENEWHGLNISRDDPLENHLATMADFIIAISKSDDEKGKTALFHKFTYYIIACSMRKMQRRIDHWSSDRFIASLAYAGQQVQILYNRFGKQVKRLTHRTDTALGYLLKSMSEDHIQAVMQEYPSAGPHEVLRLSKLKASFEKVLGPEPAGATAYNEDTCVEFHQLLVAVLFGYRRALKVFHEARENWKSCCANADAVNGGMGTENTVDTADIHLFPFAFRLWNFSHLLWRIAYSQTLRYHLTVLEAGQLLFCPLQPPNSQCNEEDVEALSLLRSRPDRGAVWTFQQWIRLQVSHFSELDTLSVCSSHPEAEDVQISLLIVQNPCLSPMLVEPWEDTIKRLVPPSGVARLSSGASSFDPQAAIDLLKRRRDNGQLHVRELYIMNQLSSPDTQFPGNVHSAAALASFHSNGENKGSLGLENLDQCLDQSSIAVSKICCPVCWDLLNILRTETTHFSVCSRHSIISPVELPAWLSVDVLQKMVLRYRQYLQQGLATLMKREAEGDGSISGL